MAGDMPLRPFGQTGVQISAIACGGHHLGDPDDQKIANQIVDEAIDGGITFFDNCWEYHRGKCEDYLAELFKMTVKYDGKVGREQHHFPSAQELSL